MKKTYQIPAVNVESMELEEVIAASVTLYGTNAESDGLSRELDIFWENED